MENDRDSHSWMIVEDHRRGPPPLHTELEQICSAFANGELDRASFFEGCSRVAVAEVGCTRAGIWAFRNTDRGRALHCLALHDQAKGAMTMVSDGEVGEDVATYIQALEQAGYVMATDARVHYATAGIYASHLEPSGVESLMSATFAIDTERLGAFTCAHVGRQMEWSRSQLIAVRRIGAAMEVALQAARCHGAEDGANCRIEAAIHRPNS